MLTLAKAQRQQDQAQLENAQADFKRCSSLARSDFASRQQVETRQSSVGRLQGVLAADDAAIEEAQLNLGFCVLHAPMNGRVGLRRVDPGNLIQITLGILYESYSLTPRNGQASEQGSVVQRYGSMSRTPASRSRIGTFRLSISS